MVAKETVDGVVGLFSNEGDCRRVDSVAPMRGASSSHDARRVLTRGAVIALCLALVSSLSFFCHRREGALELVEGTEPKRKESFGEYEHDLALKYFHQSKSLWNAADEYSKRSGMPAPIGVGRSLVLTCRC